MKSRTDTSKGAGGRLLGMVAVVSAVGLVVVLLLPPAPPKPEADGSGSLASPSGLVEDPDSLVAAPGNAATQLQPPDEPAAAPRRQPSQPFDTQVEQGLLLADVEKAIADFPNDAKLLHLGAVTYAEMLQTERALDLFEASLAIDSQDASVFVAYADLLLQVGRADEAMARLEAGRESAGDSTVFGIALAKAYSQCAELEKARELLEGLKPDAEYVSSVKLELARVQNQLQEFAAAEANARYVVDAGTTDRAAYLVLSTALMRQGKRDAAVEVREQMPEIEQQLAPGDQAYQKSFRKFAAHTYAVLGSAFEVKGLFGEAEDKLLYSVALDPSSESALMALVSLMRKQARIQDALKWQQKAAEVAPENILHVVNLASLAAAVRDFPLAEKSLYKAVELDDTGQAALQLAQFLMGIGKPVEAVQAARQGVALSGALEAHLILMMALKNQGDKLATAQAYLEAKKLYPDAPQLVGFQP